MYGGHNVPLTSVGGMPPGSAMSGGLGHQQHLSVGGSGGSGLGGNTGTSNQKHDIFVGNLAFNTTEEQLHQVFSEIGRVVKVRMVTDAETGKPRGFSFVEFEDPQAALAAIRNMNDYELNGRNLRVNFSNSSHLETLAKQLGMDMTQKTSSDGKDSSGAGAGGKPSTEASSAANKTQAVADAIKSLSKGEMWDIVSQFKAVADKNPDEARSLLCVHPQMPEAILYLMSQLEMIKTPLPAVSGMLPGAPSPASVVMPSAPSSLPNLSATMPSVTSSGPTSIDPRLRAASSTNAGALAPPPPGPPPPVSAMDPRQQATAVATRGGVPPPPPPSDPRTRAADPRMQQQQGFPPPPPSTSAYQPPPPPPTTAAAQQLDPALVQQVLSLTPAQIAQLPPDKQQSILALRHQITGGR